MWYTSNSERKKPNTERKKMSKPTTGPRSVKEYKCTTCGAVEKHSTNHWGAIYPACRSCSWKNPMEGQVFECLEECPETHDKPEPWTKVALSDVVGKAHAKKTLKMWEDCED
jgi:hypothetical protein